MSKTAVEYYNSAIYKDDSGDYQGALADYNQAIEINPQFTIAYYNRAILKENHLQDYQGALTDYNQTIKIDPQHTITYYNRGYLKQDHLKDYQGALSDYNQAIEINPQYTKAINNRKILLESHPYLNQEEQTQKENDITEYEKELLKSYKKINDLKNYVQNIEIEYKRIDKELSEEIDQSLCVICFERKRSVLFLPCRHNVTCKECYNQLNPKECPMDRKIIEIIIEMFLS